MAAHQTLQASTFPRTVNLIMNGGWRGIFINYGKVLGNASNVKKIQNVRKLVVYLFLYLKNALKNYYFYIFSGCFNKDKF